MRYLSVCSGIEAASVAWRPLGWECAGVSEIDKFPRAVLEHRLGAVPVDDDHRWTPGQNFTPLFGDFTKIEAHHVGPIDLLVGGSPCQSFSIAGKRLGLDDPRGHLTLEFLALAKRVRPTWIVYENVPGILSDDGGRTFGTFLGLLGECGYRFAYRVLDAQYVRTRRFGRAVPQRRRRVFVVGYSGTADINPAAVLFDRESLRGNPAPRRQAGEGIAGYVGDRSALGVPQRVDAPPRAQAKAAGGRDGGDTGALGRIAEFARRIVEDGTALQTRAEGRGIADAAPTLAARTRGGGGLGTDFDCDGGLIAGQDWPASVAPTLNAAFGSKLGLEDQHVRGGAAYSSPPVANPLTARMHKGINTTADEGQTPIIQHGGGFDDAQVAHSLRAEGFDASEDGTGRGTPIVPVCRDVAPALTSNYGKQVDSSDTSAGPMVLPVQHPTAVAFDMRGREGGAMPEGPHDTANIRAASGGSSRSYAASAAWEVRRLTPRECERLQGFPDAQNSYILVICQNSSDLQKHHALAAHLCPKKPSNVWLANAGEWMLSAEAADQHFSINPAGHALPVALDVLIDLERMQVLLHSAGRYCSFASTAGKKSASHPPTQDEDFARLAARMTQIWESEIRDGKVASHPGTAPSTPHRNGRIIALSSGSATEEPAGDAESIISVASQLSMSTTSGHGLSGQTSDSTLTTLCCSVAHAIRGFIPPQIESAPSYAIRVTASEGWTAIPWRGKPASGCPDGPRYKSLGNSFAVNVITWIGERLQAVMEIENANVE